MMNHTLQFSYSPPGQTCDVSTAVPRHSQLTTTAKSSCMTQALSIAYRPNSLFANYSEMMSNLVDLTTAQICINIQNLKRKKEEEEAGGRGGGEGMQKECFCFFV